MNDSEIKQVPFESQYVLELEFPKRAMSHIERHHYQYGNFRVLISEAELDFVERINSAVGQTIIQARKDWYHIDGMECFAYDVTWVSNYKFVTPREWRKLNSRLANYEFMRMQMYQVSMDADRR